MCGFIDLIKMFFIKINAFIDCSFAVVMGNPSVFLVSTVPCYFKSSRSSEWFNQI
jgi:hypothetical protein